MHRIVFIAVVLAFAPRAFAAEPQAMSVAAEKETLAVMHDGKPVLRYRFEGVPFKPYVKELYTPGGINILRDAPADHLHHHALMYAMNVDGVDFWGEEATAGKQTHLSFGATSNEGRGRARVQEKLAWVDPARKQTLLLETRTLTAVKPEAINATILSWVSEFSLPEGRESATLTGSHYHGLGMRFPVSMDTGGEFRNSAGVKGEVYRGEERLGRAAWCAYTAKADGKAVTVAMFDHPENVRAPATWFMMSAPFAYLSATIALYKEPLKLERGKTLVLKYGVAVWDGRPDDAMIGQTCARWVARMQRPAAENK